MRIIKKYGNRRLYDTDKSAYINLDELAALVRGGQEVRVIAAKGGEDLTREVLLQVVLENLQGGELFNVSMLHRIIRSTGDDPWQLLLRKQLAAGMEMLSTQMDQVERVFSATMSGAPDMDSPSSSAGGSTPRYDQTPAPDVVDEVREDPDPSYEPEPAEPEPKTPPTPQPAPDQELDALRARLAALEERLRR